MRCRLCGHVFEAAALACHASCPLGSRCSLICCPNCGYQVVDESKSGMVRVLRRLWPSAGEPQVDRVPPREDAVPLTHVGPGTPVEVQELAQMPASRASRLTAFGVTPGTIVTLAQRRPVPVVRIGETELALSDEIVEQIHVRPPAPAPRGGSAAV
jgi:Fe2+ transport system protein FeoA